MSREHIRDRILNVIENEYKKVSEIAEELDENEAKIYKHMGTLRKQNSVARFRPSSNGKVGRSPTKYKKRTR